MIDFGDRKDLLVLFIIGILVVVAAMIFSLIMIWTPKEEKVEFAVGDVIQFDSISDEYKINMYLKDFSKLIVNNEYEKLYKYVGQDYIEYSGMDVGKLKQKFEQSNIAGQELILENYETKKINGYNNIYILTVASKKDNSSIRMTIREKSTRQCTIAFEDFLLLEKTLLTKVSENITLELLQTRYMSNNVIYDLRITNKNPYSVYINSTEKNGSFLINYNDDLIAEQNQFIDSNVLELVPGEIQEFNLVYDIRNIDLTKIKGITLRDVKSTNDRVNNILFEF